MSKKMYEDLKETLNDELRALAKKGELSRESLDSIYKLAETLKAIDKLLKAEGGESSYGQGSNESGYSRESYGMNSRRGSYDGSYNQGSYNRGSNAGGGSNRGSYDGSYNQGSYESYEGGSNEGSYARRGRDGDGDGRYNESRSSRNYSRHTSKERMIEKLEMMMKEASTEKEREAIINCIEQLDY